MRWNQASELINLGWLAIEVSDDLQSEREGSVRIVSLASEVFTEVNFDQ